MNQPQQADPIVDEDIVSLAPLGRFIWRYRHWLTVCFFGCVLAAVGLLATLALVLPHTTNASVGLGLRFVKPNKGYNMLDLISTEVLKKVFQANQLEQYLEFGDFKSSLTVKSTGDSLVALQSEYKTKLGSPKMLSEERERLEKEYKIRRQAIINSEHSLVWTQNGRLAKLVPASVTA